MSGYCASAPGHPLHGPYHDTEYGFPVAEEAILFERLCLEIFQAGLSWELVLRKRPGMNAAFDGFQVDRVAAYGETEVARLLADVGIIRNRLKVAAIIENARRVQALRASHGGFADWLAVQDAVDKADWVKRFRRTFKFMGGEVVGEFLMSIGHLPGAHRADCPIHRKILRLSPPWMAKGR